jgi:hypothetical protein
MISPAHRQGRAALTSEMDETRRIWLKAGAALAVTAAVPFTAAAAGRQSSNGAEHAHDFDFLHGRWFVQHRKLRERLADSTEWIQFSGTLDVAPILSGLGNFDRNVLRDPRGAYEAASLRLFNPASGLWSIWWFDGRAPANVDPPVVGGFDGQKGAFYSDGMLNGRPIRVRTTYEPLGAAEAHWTQAFSADQGRTWEVNWHMNFHKA